MRPRTAADALQYPLGWLRDLELSLDLRCSCTWSVMPSFRMILDRSPHLRMSALGDVLPRLRCQKRCRQRHVRAELLHQNEHAGWAGNRRDQPRPWSIVLVGDEPPLAA